MKSNIKYIAEDHHKNIDEKLDDVLLALERINEVQKQQQHQLEHQQLLNQRLLQQQRQDSGSSILTTPSADRDSNVFQHPRLLNKLTIQIPPLSAPPSTPLPTPQSSRGKGSVNTTNTNTLPTPISTSIPATPTHIQTQTNLNSVSDNNVMLTDI